MRAGNNAAFRPAADSSMLPPVGWHGADRRLPDTFLQGEWQLSSDSRRAGWQDHGIVETTPQGAAVITHQRKLQAVAVRVKRQQSG